jgi:hypothetical protein
MMGAILIDCLWLQGSTAGPMCEPTAAGVCGWQVRQCPSFNVPPAVIDPAFGVPDRPSVPSATYTPAFAQEHSSCTQCLGRNG